MFANEVLNSGAMPTLEAMMRFAGARHRIIAHNIANISTPNFIQQDVSVPDFQKELARAIEERRNKGGGMQGPLHLNTDEVQQSESGEFTLIPKHSSDGVLFHDRNNRDIERLMQDHAENVGVYRIASELMRSRMQQVRDAIGERV